MDIPKILKSGCAPTLLRMCDSSVDQRADSERQNVEVCPSGSRRQAKGWLSAAGGRGGIAEVRVAEAVQGGEVDRVGPATTAERRVDSSQHSRHGRVEARPVYAGQLSHYTRHKRSFHRMHKVVDRGVLQAMWEELASKVLLYTAINSLINAPPIARDLWRFTNVL